MNEKQFQIIKSYLNSEKKYTLNDAELSLMDIAKSNNINLIDDLVLLLDDNSDFIEIMFVIIQTIEYLYKGDIHTAIYKMFDSTSKYLNNRKDWLSTLHHRILNSTEINIYFDILKKHFDNDENIKYFVNEIQEENENLKS